MQKCKLSEIADLTVGYVGNMKAEYVEKGIPFLRSLNISRFNIKDDDLMYISKEFNKNLLKSELHTGDVVVVRTGIPGTCAVIPPQYNGANCSDLVIIRPHKGINPHFIAAFINFWGQKQIANAKVGAVQKHFNVGAAKDMTIFLPDNQDSIANYLTALNDKISNNQRIISTLESLSKTLYDYYFLQFDFPDEKGRPYKSNGGKMEYNAELGREIPAGWKCKSVKDICDIQYGYPFDTALFSDEKGIPVVRIRDIQELSTSAYTTEEVDNKYLLKRNDLIVGMDGNFHMNFWAGKESLLNQRIFRIRGKEDVSTLSVYFAIKPYIEHREKNVTRTTVGHLSDYDVKLLKIVLPNDIELRKKIANKFETLLNQITQIREENWELASLRDFLLPMLMNGQVGFKK